MSITETARSTLEFDPIELEICWQSLIATVNEQAKALQRSAFSPIVREAGDLANACSTVAVAWSPRRSPAPRATSTAWRWRWSTSSRSTRSTSSSQGDVLITNDPYKTAGQLLDVTVLVPVWRGGRIIALFGSTIHHTDVGGYGIGAGGRDVFEEGLWIPIVKLMKRGERNDDVWKFILSNVRQPDHMGGDLHAQMASGEIGAQRPAGAVRPARPRRHRSARRRDHRRSEEATRAGIRELPAGTYASSAARPRRRQRDRDPCALTVDPDTGEITVDYTGSADASPWGINVVSSNYTHAYTTFTVRSVLNPDIPNNHGSLAPIEMIAPEGSIVNAVSPRPCTARHVVGMFLPNALLKALAQVRPDEAMAEGSGAVWTMQVSGNHDDGSPFITAMFTYAGGVGARATKPGLDACSYPTGVAAVPIEVVEASAPIRFTRRRCARVGRRRAPRPAGSARPSSSRSTPRVRGSSTRSPAGSPNHPRCLRRRARRAGAFSVNGEAVAPRPASPSQPDDVVRSTCPAAAATAHPSRPTRTERPDAMAHDRAHLLRTLGSDRRRHGSRLFLRFEGARSPVTEWTYAEFDDLTAGWRARSRRRRRPRRGCTSHSRTHRRSWPPGSPPSGSARSSSPPTRWPPRRSWPTTSPAPVRRSGCAPPTGPPPTATPFDAGPVVFEVDEADTDLAVLAAGPRPCWNRSPTRWRRGGDVHQRHHRATQGRRDHPGQLRVRRRPRWPMRPDSPAPTDSSWCCRCSTPTPSTTRSPQRSPSVRPSP
jgi:N-methylhydantoinase B